MPDFLITDFVRFLEDGVRNVTVTPSRKVFQPGDSLACRADGNPKPTYQWTELSESTDNSMLLVHGSYLNVSRRMVREELYTFQCTASNDIDTKEFSDTVRIAFSVRGKQSINHGFVYWRKNIPSDTDAGENYNKSEAT